MITLTPEEHRIPIGEIARILNLSTVVARRHVDKYSLGVRDPFGRRLLSPANLAFLIATLRAPSSR
jgi:hypothetical protein